MRSRTLKNTEELLRLLYPTIINWATQYDYSIPSVPVLLKYVVKFNMVASWKSVYNKIETDAIGTHQANPAVISVAAEREHSEILSTLIHEYAHAVQYFNLGSDFHTEYSAEATVRQHGENKYENEARTLSNKLAKACRLDTDLNVKLASFKFIYATKPGPKTHLKKKLRRQTPRRQSHDFLDSPYEECYTQEFTHYSDNPIFKCNKNAWWLRR